MIVSEITEENGKLLPRPSLAAARLAREDPWSALERLGKRTRVAATLK